MEVLYGGGFLLPATERFFYTADAYNYCSKQKKDVISDILGCMTKIPCLLSARFLSYTRILHHLPVIFIYL
jgi:hypothetical protein